MGFWARFAHGISRTGTTLWGAITVGAVVVQQNPGIIGAFVHNQATLSQISAISGAVAAIAGVLTAAKAADANKTLQKTELANFGPAGQSLAAGMVRTEEAANGKKEGN